MCEGNCHCGPYWMNDSLKCILSIFFNKECKIHDDDYKNANGSKYQCDLRFLKNLTIRCFTWYLLPLLPLTLIMALLFFFSVLTPLGQKSWDLNREAENTQS